MTLRELINKVGEENLDYKLSLEIYVEHEPDNFWVEINTIDCDVNHLDGIISLGG